MPPLPPAIEEMGWPSLLCERRTERVCSCRGQCPCVCRRYRYRFGCTHLPRFCPSVASSFLCGARALFSLPFLSRLCFCVAMTCPTSCIIPLPPSSAATQCAPARSHAHAHGMPWSGRTFSVSFSFSLVLLPLRLLAFIAFRVSPRFLGFASDPPPIPPPPRGGAEDRARGVWGPRTARESTCSRSGKGRGRGCELSAARVEARNAREAESTSMRLRASSAAAVVGAGKAETVAPPVPAARSLLCMSALPASL